MHGEAFETTASELVKAGARGVLSSVGATVGATAEATVGSVKEL